MDNEHHGLWCSWVLRDFDNNAVVAKGKAFDQAGSQKRVTGLYNRYKLFVSNYSCYGVIDNNP